MQEQRSRYLSGVYCFRVGIVRVFIVQFLLTEIFQIPGIRSGFCVNIPHSRTCTIYRARKRAAEKAATKPKEQKEQKSENPVPEEKPVKKSPYTTAFETLWSTYPRKKDKGNAYKKYKARLNDGWSEEELLAAVTAYATECKRNRTDEKYIKHASTFFSETTPFVDYLKKKEETVKPERTDESNPFR